MFEKIKLWFTTRKELRRQVSFLSRLLNQKIEISVDILKELDQNKFYFCYVKDATPEDVSTLQDYYKLAKRSLNWSPPIILFVNKELKFMTDTDVNELIIKYKKSAKNG